MTNRRTDFDRAEQLAIAATAAPRVREATIELVAELLPYFDNLVADTRSRHPELDGKALYRAAIQAIDPACRAFSAETDPDYRFGTFLAYHVRRRLAADQADGDSRGT